MLGQTAPLETVEWVKLVASLPLTALLVLVLVGGSLGWWIYGSIHKTEMADLAAQRDRAVSDAKFWMERFLAELTRTGKGS